MALAGRAQQGAVLPKVGVLSVGTTESSAHLVKTLVQGLSALDVEDKTIVVIRRYAQGRLDQLDSLAVKSDGGSDGRKIRKGGRSWQKLALCIVARKERMTTM